MLKDILDSLPEANGVCIILSGGLDSTIAMRLTVEKYGAPNVSALTFDYGQRQSLEIERARESTALLGVKHHVVDASFLGKIAQGFSANVDRAVQMPTIQDALGDPAPKSYVPNRNMILLSIAAAYAEVNNAQYIFCGLQSVDEYGYHDTTPSFVASINASLAHNRKNKITILAPFNRLTKLDELNILQELDGNIDLVKHTLSCYNPDEEGRACAVCPTCSERINNFIKFGKADPNPYQIYIPWETLIES